MEGKEWFEKSKYVYSLDEHDEGGYLGIDENKVAEMLDEYYQYKLKLLGISGVVSSLPTKEQILSDMMAKDEELGLYDQPTDCDGTPLEYGDEMVCVKEFTDIDGVTWRELEESPYRKIQKINPKYSEFTHSELKNFRKLL